MSYKTKEEKAQEYLKLLGKRQKQLMKRKSEYEPIVQSKQMQFLDDKNKLEDIERLQEDYESLQKLRQRNRKMIAFLQKQLTSLTGCKEDQKIAVTSNFESKRLDPETTQNLAVLRLEIADLKVVIEDQLKTINEKDRRLLKLANKIRPVSSRLRKEVETLNSNLHNVQSRLKLLKHTEDLVQTNNLESLKGLLDQIKGYMPDKPQFECSVTDA